MEKKSRKEFKELSEEQLQEVTGGGAIVAGLACGMADSSNNNCPSHRYDLQCHCID